MTITPIKQQLYNQCLMKQQYLLCLIASMILLFPALLYAAPAGYTTYYIPGAEEDMAFVFEDSADNRIVEDWSIGNGDGINMTDPMNSIIGITAWSDNTRIYIDHWEDGYELDVNDPDTADEVCAVQNTGGHIELISEDVPPLTAQRSNFGNDCSVIGVNACSISNTANGCYYDGKDKIYVAGGNVTITRISLPEMICSNSSCTDGSESPGQHAGDGGSTGPSDGTAAGVQAIGWEVFPVRPQLTTYIMPIGEDLATGADSLQDFRRVYAIIQATQDNTSVQVDFNGGGFDNIDVNRDGDCSDPNEGASVTLDEGETLVLNRDSDGNGGCGISDVTFNVGTTIKGAETIQVQYVTANENSNLEIRGFSAFPRGLWDDEYYAPVDTRTSAVVSQSGNVNIYLHNPHSGQIMIDYTTTSTSGTIAIDPNETVAFETETGSFPPNGSAVYFKSQGNEVFWGVATTGQESSVHDWGYSLVPAFELSDEYYLGWAPAGLPIGGSGNFDISGLFLTPQSDNARVFVDFNADGTPDTTFSIDRLDTQYICDGDNQCGNATGTEDDGDLTGAAIWSTSPFAAAFGQNPEFAPGGTPAVDIGYTALSGAIDFVDIVLAVEKTTDPAVLGTGAGEVTRYTIVVDTDAFDVENVEVVDQLVTGFSYCDASTVDAGAGLSAGDCADPVITFPNKTTSNDAPSISSQTLTWDSADWTGGQLDMAAQNTLTIEYSAYTDATHTSGDVVRSVVEASGSRDVGSPTITQTFTATDGVFNTFVDADMSINIVSDVTTAANPGDTINYTVTVTNTGSTALNNISVNNNMPGGITFVSGTVQHPAYTQTTTSTFVDLFDVQSYSNSDGTASWTTSWTEDENNDGTPDPGTSPSAGQIRIFTGNSAVVLTRVFGATGAATYSLQRAVNLTGFTNINLSFNILEFGTLEASDRAQVEYFDSATSMWVSAFDMSDDFGTQSVSVSNIPNTTTIIRITATNYQGDGGGNEFLLVDDVTFTYDQSTVTAAGTDPLTSPPDIVSGGASYDLAVGESLLINYSTTVEDPWTQPTNFITNLVSAVSDEILVPVTDSVTDPVVVPSTDSATVTGKVWFDIDGDGVIDLGEPGFSNASVALKDEFGATIATTTTDGNGDFTFTNVPLGNDYLVEVDDTTIPSGLTQVASTGSNDRSNTFDLTTAGQTYSDANIGYDATNGTLGDRIWSDDDADRIQDAGEPGIAGVTVVLYNDDGDTAGTFDENDTVRDTQVTDASGNYLFTNVPASGTEDYFIGVAVGTGTANETVLSGYTSTTGNSLAVVDLASNATLLSLDLGYQNTTTAFDIKDRIWFDFDGTASTSNTEDDDNNSPTNNDNAESGISGVTVDLLDSSLNVIATTTTATDGTFEFTGVLGNSADYTIKITDTNAVLVDYFATTSESQSGTIAVDNLAEDRDYTDESSADFAGSTDPRFGFNLSGTVGGSAFNDADNGGDFDTSELGLSGITVSLYTVSTGGTAVATLTTGSDGSYLFTGLDDGTYFVEILDAQGALSGFTRTTSAGRTSKTVSSGSNELDADFGYNAADNRTISGTIWDNDVVVDGNVDAGEATLESVTVELEQSGSIVATTSTNAAGNFSFTNLPGGTYTARVTDTGGVLVGFTSNYEDGSVGAGNGETSVNVSSGDSTSNDFGFETSGALTYSLIRDVRAYVVNGEVVLEWQTSSEINTLGFYIERYDPGSDQFITVSTQLLPALIGSGRGGLYQWVDLAAWPSETYQYRLIELESTGNKRTYGPYDVTVDASNLLTENYLTFDQSFVGTPHQASQFEQQRLHALSQATVNREYFVIDGMKIYTQSEGMYQVSANQIAQTLNIRLSEVQSRLQTGQFALTNQSYAVDWVAAEDLSGLRFYAQAIDSPFTPNNVYWLTLSMGQQMASISAQAPTAVNDPLGFSETLSFSDGVILGTNTTRHPDQDLWFWDFVFAGIPGFDHRTFTLSTPNVISGQPAQLSIELEGGSIAENQADIILNDVVIDSIQWPAWTTYRGDITLPANLLQSGDNVVGVVGTLVPDATFSLFYIDHFDIQYQRAYQATNDRLAFSLDGASARVTIDGFSQANIEVFDVSQAKHPVMLTATTIDPTPGGFSVSFIAPTPDGRYIALTDASWHAAHHLQPNVPSHLTRQKADYLIITSAALYDGAQALADYRATTGYTPLVVLLEDIYDEFNDGIAHPLAIRSFIHAAALNWSLPPTYVTLLGKGTFDYYDFTGTGDNIVPIRAISTVDGLFASDNAFTDFNLDGSPDIAIGRIPALTNQEVVAYIDKLQQYEHSAIPNNVVMLSDNSDSQAHFTEDSRFMGSLANGRSVTTIGLDDQSLNDVKQQTIAAFNQGSLWINYIGHGAIDIWADEGIFRDRDVAQLTNSQYPVVTALTCLSNQFSFPGFSSLGETLVMTPERGAIAVWGASALSEHGIAMGFNAGLFDQVFSRQTTTLGEAIRRTLQPVASTHGNGGLSGVAPILPTSSSSSSSAPPPLPITRTPTAMPSVYILLGDPGLQLKH